jgi:NADH:ubiquinone oxidoreductase subunit C
MSKFTAEVETLLAAAAPGGIELRKETDAKGVTTAWCSLAESDELYRVAGALKKIDARLSTMSFFQPLPPEPQEEEAPAEGEEAAAPAAPEPHRAFGGTVIDGHTYQVVYHFDLDGDTLSITVFVPAGGAVQSLTPLYRAADWTERELMELYAIRVADHPNPKRLFVDESIEGAVLERLIPYSTLVNAASTKALWDKIIGDKGEKQ